jgi:hypothetical protein
VAHVSSTSIVDAARLERLRQCRRDIVDEELEAADDVSASYRAVRAPFATYRRQLDVSARPDGRFDVEQRIDYTWALPLWWAAFAIPARRVLLKPGTKPRGGRRRTRSISAPRPCSRSCAPSRWSPATSAP